MHTQTHYRLGPFNLDVRGLVLRREGRKVNLREQGVIVLKVFLEHPDELLTYKELGRLGWGEGRLVEIHAVHQTVAEIKKALEKEFAKYIITRRKRGYFFDKKALERAEQKTQASTASSGFRPDPCGHIQPRPEIENFLSKHKLALDSIDEYIELEGCADGWRRDEVVVVDAGRYQPSEDFVRLMHRFIPEPPIRQYYSLHEVESSVQDEQRKLILYFQGGDWRYIHSLSEVARNVQQDPDCRGFRQRCEREFMPTPTSSLYRNVNCEVLVVSSDNQIVLGRRRTRTKSGEIVPVSEGAWAASLEEQMLRADPDSRKNPDIDLFTCAQRGVEEELQVSIDPEYTRLLSYGIEWGNFTAAFLFLVKTKADFETIIKQWRRAEGRNETVALDALPADENTVAAALLKHEWCPSGRARTWKGKYAISTNCWHPTARARLCAYLRHVAALSHGHSVPV